MKLAVFGVTGGTGDQIVRQALEQGHDVTAFARRPEVVGERHPAARVMAGDVHDKEAVAKAVAGADAVVSALGNGGDRNPTRVYSEGVTNILDGMREAGTRRFVCVSTTALDVTPDDTVVQRLVARLLLQRILREPYTDMRRMEQMVRDSDLDWTIVRAARLTDGPLTGNQRVARHGRLRSAWSISRADLADHVLSSLTDIHAVQTVAEVAY